jgi:tryptophanyl-tRNA synthetase
MRHINIEGSNPMTQRIFSGIRATGRLHLGNYLGAIKGMLALQDDPQYQMLFSVVDIHAMTTPYDRNRLADNTYNVILDYLAAGMDPEKSLLIVQSQVADLHAELMFYFSTTVSMARMQHLPTFKEKIRQHPHNVTMALLNYPVLMAADILMYHSSLVPVGIDQEPHLEVTREIARKMNESYGTHFPEPQRFATQGEYVPSLKGEGKMSKSVEGSYLNLTDDLDAIRAGLAGAPTDSGQGETIPEEGGVANLLTLVELFEGESKRKQYEAAYLNEGIRYRDIKEDLAQAIYMELEPIQAKRQELERQPEHIKEVIHRGTKEAREIAQQTLAEVKEKVGILKLD